MKTVAIVAEYNPFHQGHAWQLRAIREHFGQDCAILAVMSGCFTQRGEPAILDKWSRTRMALACGVDLVIELPFAYACASAERFARGGVQMIQATGLDCHLAFGSETGNLAQLLQLAEILSEEPTAFRQHLHRFLDLGESFPAARQRAVAELTGQADLAALLNMSNNILGVEYLKALRLIPAPRLTPISFKRQGQDYNDTRLDFQTEFASATAIRRSIAGHWSNPVTCQSPHRDPDGLFQTLIHKMPDPALAILLEQISLDNGPLFLEDLAVPLLNLLRSRPVSQIEQAPGMGEGLGRRLMHAAARPLGEPGSGRVETLLKNAGTRRFPKTRIQRSLVALLAGLTNEDLALFDSAGGPMYLRVLGFSRKGRYLLKIMRGLAEKPILMKASDILEHKDPALIRMAELDLWATDLWKLASGQNCGTDFDTPVVMG